MSLKKQFEDLEKWASGKNILIIEGDFKQGKGPIVEIPNNDPSSIDIFKKLIENLEAKVIISDTLYFSSKKFKIYKETVDYLKDEIKNKFDILKNLENQFLGYCIVIFREGMTFKFWDYVDEIEVFLEVEEAVLDYIEQNQSENEENEFPEEIIIECGVQLAEHENYSKIKNRQQRENFARDYFKEKFNEFKVDGSFYSSLIVAHSESHYDIHVRPRKEKELKQKISELQGRGYTKVKIAAELNVSKDTVNKFI